MKISILLITLLVFAPVSQAQQAALVIEDVTLIDGTGRGAVGNSSVLIRGSRIEQVIRGNFPATIKAEAKVIDGRGKFLIPGLMDIHIHLRGGTEVTSSGLRKMKASRKTGIEALHSYIYSGVTTVYDAGNNPDFILGLRADERSGKIVAPRLFATGGIVTYPGSHGSGVGATLIDRWPEGKAELDKHIAQEPDLLKLTYEERGWGARPMIPMLPLDMMEKIIHYYNDRGIRTTVHVAGERRARQAIFAGIDTLAHPVIVGPITDDFARLMGAKKIPMATTLTIGDNYSRLAEEPEFLDQALYRAVLTPGQIGKLKNETRTQYQERTWTWWMKIMTGVAQENLRKIHAAGGVLALGTDQTIGPAVHREMELLADAGIPNLDIIKIATLNGALFLGKDNELGSITEGKLADLVLLDKNPITNINHAKAINLVIKHGKVIGRSKLKLSINQ